MAEAIVRLESTPALPPVARRLADGVTLRVVAPRTYVRLQLARSHARDATSIHIGDVPLPTVPNRCHGEDPAVLWTAPDGWLLASSRLAGAELCRSARVACGERTAAAVDVSDALVTLGLEGRRVRDVLARGTGLDLARESFGPGQCARTRLAQLAVLLRPRTDETVELIVDRAPAEWLCEWLADAAAGLGVHA